MHVCRVCLIFKMLFYFKTSNVEYLAFISIKFSSHRFSSMLQNIKRIVTLSLSSWVIAIYYLNWIELDQEHNLQHQKTYRNSLGISFTKIILTLYLCSLHLFILSQVIMEKLCQMIHWNRLDLAELSNDTILLILIGYFISLNNTLT